MPSQTFFHVHSVIDASMFFSKIQTVVHYLYLTCPPCLLYNCWVFVFRLSKWRHRMNLVCTQIIKTSTGLVCEINLVNVSWKQDTHNRHICWVSVVPPPLVMMLLNYFRWFVHEAGDGNNGGTGLVPRSAWNYSNTSVRVWHGFIKGKFTIFDVTFISEFFAII